VIAKERPSKTLTGPWKRRIWNGVGAVLAILLIWLIWRAADWRVVAAQIRKANLGLLLFTWIFLGGASWVLRAVRWRVLLTVEKPLAFWPVLWANSAGNLANNLLPARAGEFIRSAMVCASSGLTQRFVLATAACERVLDLLVFVALAEIAVTRASNIPPPLLHAIHLGFALAVTGVAFLLAMSRSEKFIHSLVARGLRRPHMALQIQARLEPVLAGLRSIHSLNRIFGFLALSVLIWMLDVSGTKLVADAMGLHLPFSVCFLLIAGLVLISLLPAAPGQIGVYQWVVIRAVAMSHVGYNEALAYSFVLQGGGYLALTLLSVPGFLFYRQSRGNPHPFGANAKAGN
jgi:uncharacterized protein (TIRG00374 family)